MPHVPELLSVVLHLQARICQPVEAKNWYGFAAQGALLRALRLEGFRRAAGCLHDAEGLRPYTASTLFPAHSAALRGGCLHPHAVYHLRYTALNPASAALLLRACQPGACLGPGGLLTLAGTAFQIARVDMRACQHEWAGAATYDSLAEAAAYLPPGDGDVLRMRFFSPTLFACGDGRTTPQISAHALFKHILEKWYSFATISYPFPDDFLDVLRTHAIQSGSDLHEQRVYAPNGVYFTGSKGWLELRFNGAARLYYKELRLLATYAFFCGAGKATTWGFGQCRQI